jgi:hypothetical protein
VSATRLSNTRYVLFILGVCYAVLSPVSTKLCGVLKYTDLLSVLQIHHMILSTSLKKFRNISGYQLCRSGDDLAGCLIEPLQHSGATELELEIRDSKENGIEL